MPKTKRTMQQMSANPDELAMWERVGDKIGVSRRYGARFRKTTVFQLLQLFDELDKDHEHIVKLNQINAYK